MSKHKQVHNVSWFFMGVGFDQKRTQLQSLSHSTIFDSQEKTCKNTECKDKNMKDRSSENKC